LRSRTAVAATRAAALLAAALLCAFFAPAAAGAKQSGWGRPFRLTPPYSTDLTPVSLSIASGGAAAAGFSAQDQDTPATSDPFIAIRAASGSVSAPFSVPGAQLVLDLAYDRSGLRLLTGTSESGKACCSTVQTMSLLHDGRFGRPSTLVGKLAGAAVGSLTPLPGGRLLATVATDRGVWVAQSGAGDGSGPTHRLSAAAAMPWTVATAADAQGHTAVAWTATQGQQGEVAPNQIVAASGSARSVPGRSHPAFKVGGGHQIDEIGLAPKPGGATAAWIETWFDRRGAYHAETVLADLGSSSRRAYSVAGEAASGVAIAGGPRGDQVAAWRSCTPAGSCSVRAAVRPAGGQFGPSQRLGAIDPGQPPAVAVARSGEAIVGWIAAGNVVAAERRPGAGRLGSPRAVSSTTFAANLAIAFGGPGGGQALAAWTQGTLAPDVVGSVFRG
jgi:hypothetical protein